MCGCDKFKFCSFLVQQRIYLSIIIAYTFYTIDLIILFTDSNFNKMRKII